MFFGDQSGNERVTETATTVRRPISAGQVRRRIRSPPQVNSLNRDLKDRRDDLPPIAPGQRGLRLGTAHSSGNAAGRAGIHAIGTKTLINLTGGR